MISRSLDPLCGVGGFVQITTVREHGIATRILKRWHDAIGEKLT
jgi:hypothetical protein